MSFEELVKRISPVLKRITYKLNGHFSFFNDEDLYQEALMHLWRDFTDGKLHDKTDSYMLQGCYFHLKNYLRKVQDKACVISMDTLFDEEGGRLEETVSSDMPEACFEYLDSKLLFERMQEWGLSAREKEIVYFCMEGLTVREIGKRLKISHVMVVKLKNKIQNKCEKFKEEIKEGYQNR